MYNPYDSTDALVDGASAVQNIDQKDPDADDTSNAVGRDITMLDHTATIEAGTGANAWGNDVMAGGAGNDTLFGELGNDVVQGDGEIVDGLSPTFSVVEATTDGDDYIEGNGGDDLIYGGLGQDDIIGGSSSLYGLDNAEQRPDGSDSIYGGAGNRIDRNDVADDLGIESHARDSDTILGDNGNIFRLVESDGSGGTSFLSFNYDAARGLETIVPRTVDLLDYEYNAGGAFSGVGAGDVIRGESGDDEIHGQTGDDIIYGDSDDDDLFGEQGNDWISGGTGQDGVLGDDGKIFTSRNGTAEPLYGIAASVESFLSVNGAFVEATLNATGELKKTVDLEPFDVGGDDIIYGGLGDDWLHGGAGNDGISGAEALIEFYDDAANTPHITVDPATGRIVAIESIGGVDTVITDYYDGSNSLAKIEGHQLNFDATEDDGDDRIFGDLGDDWLVGGTGSDHMYGGLGNDILNADDNLDTNGGLNDEPDAGSGGDIAYGGGGRDLLIGNSGADRLIDWLGEFDNFVVPFKPFGNATVVRMPAPALIDFIYALAESDGADQTRVASDLGDEDRNGEPFGEIGLVTPQDADLWGLQHGQPAGSQPGNGNGNKDILR